MWTPAVVVDGHGTIFYFNEGFEVLTGHKFADVGHLSAAEWGVLFNVRSRQDDAPFPLEAMPGWLAVQRSAPADGHVKATTASGVDIVVRIFGSPLFSTLGDFVGGLLQVWEEDVSPGGAMTATLLFCDLRGHTAEASKLEPDRVKELLDVFYEHMGRLISRYDGTLMAFTGDEVFAAWGAPTPDEDGPMRAVSCARVLQDAKSALNQKLTVRGLPSVAFGIGIHTGEVVETHVRVGHLRQYTVTGDAVNCASRLCSIAGRDEIIVSSDVYAGLGDKPLAEKIEGIRFKGVERDLGPHRLWPDELRDRTGEQRGKLE